MNCVLWVVDASRYFNVVVVEPNPEIMPNSSKYTHLDTKLHRIGRVSIFFQMRH